MGVKLSASAGSRRDLRALALCASAIGGADRRGERERGFLRLRGRVVGGREAGEILPAESSPPDLGAPWIDRLLGGEAGGGGGGNPLGAWPPRPARISQGASGSEAQQGVRGHAEGGGGFDRAWATDLRLAHPQPSFLFAKIDFDAPALQVGFDEQRRVEVFIRTDQEGGLAVEQFGTLAQAIALGSEDDQLQGEGGAGGVGELERGLDKALARTKRG